MGWQGSVMHDEGWQGLRDRFWEIRFGGREGRGQVRGTFVVPVGWVRRRGAVVVVRRRRMMGGLVLGRDEAVRGSVLVQVVPVHVDGRHPAHAVLERPGPLAVLVFDFLY